MSSGGGGGGGGGKSMSGSKRPSSLLEQQFEFPSPENWKRGQTQKVQAVSYKVHNKSHFVGREDAPSCVEFTLKEDEIFSFGPQSRFLITGQFQKKSGNGEWTPCVKADGAKVTLIPNWFEMFIKDLDIFHGNTKVVSSGEDRFVSQYINAWKYNYMNTSQKKLLCPEPSHCGNGVPSTLTGWTNDEGSEWRKYADTIFLGAGKNFTFSWIPLDTQPFFQYANYFQNGMMPKVLPMPILSQLLIRFNFIDNQANLFKIVTENPTNLFRFVLKDFRYVGEHLRLNKSFQNSILNRRSLLHFPGVTRIIQQEIIPAESAAYKSVIQKVPFPEGFVIFCLPKDVSTGNYSYANSTDGTVFVKNNITKVSFAYGDETFFLTEPNLGNIKDPIIESKIFTDMLMSAPFGLKVDPDKITLETVHDGFESGPFPMVYVNLTNFGDKYSRVIPFLNDGSCLNKNNDLSITMNFTAATGSATGVTYYICLFYTDINLILDLKKKGDPIFSSPYIQKY
jgi:hypothetical protein